MSDLSYVARELILIEVEQERARLAKENKLLCEMILFDWSHKAKYKDRIIITFASILPTKYGPAPIDIRLNFDMNRTIDNNWIQYEYVDFDLERDDCLCVRLEDNYSQIIARYIDDDGSNFTCILTRKRANELIEFIESKRVPIIDE